MTTKFWDLPAWPEPKEQTMIKLNNDAEKAAWLQCLQAAASIANDGTVALAVADALFLAYKKRSDG